MIYMIYMIYIYMICIGADRDIALYGTPSPYLSGGPLLWPTMAYYGDGEILTGSVQSRCKIGTLS